MTNKIFALLTLLLFGGSAVSACAAALQESSVKRSAVHGLIRADRTASREPRSKEIVGSMQSQVEASLPWDDVDDVDDNTDNINELPWVALPRLDDKTQFCEDMKQLLRRRKRGHASVLLPVLKRLQGLAPLMGKSDRIRIGDPFFDSYALLAIALMSQELPKSGLLLEFGVAEGVSANITSKIIEGSTKPGRTLYGFDSFLGLPDEWVGGHVGAFGREGKQPRVRERVQLVTGWFNQTLPSFLLAHAGPAAFVNIDCDVYSSAMTVLSSTRPRFQCGTLLHFHEMNGGTTDGKTAPDELLALYDFLHKEEGSVQLELLNLSPRFWEPVVFRVASGC